MAKHRNNGRSNLFSSIILGNTLDGLKDESYTVTVRMVEQLLKDPEIREVAERLSFEFLEKVVEKWREKIRNKNKR